MRAVMAALGIAFWAASAGISIDRREWFDAAVECIVVAFFIVLVATS